MRKIVRILCILILALGVLLPQKEVCAKGNTPQDISNNYEWETLKIVNRERLSNGAKPISMFKKLQSATDVRKEEVATYFAHERPNGKSCFTVLDEKNIVYFGAGENIAAGHRNPAEVMNGWMNSPGHRRNILNSSYTHIGIGYCPQGGYGTSWVQMFISGCKLKELKVAGPVNEAKAGMSIDSMGLYLEITCSESNHGTSYCPITAEMCSGYSASSTKTQTVTVKYQDLKTTFVVKGNTPAPTIKVSKPKIKSISAKKANCATLKWTPVPCDGYEIRYSVKSNFKYVKKLIVKKGTAKSCTIKKMISGKKYYVKIRAFKNSDGGKVYSAFSATKTIKVK